jgi:hypothetical protein
MIADAFTDTNGVALTAHGPFINLPSYPSALTSSFVIQSNALAANLGASEYVCARYSGASFANDQLSRGTVEREASANSQIGVAVRCALDGSLSAYFLVGHSISSTTQKGVNGVPTLLGSHGGFAQGDDIEISVVGTTVTSKKNGVIQFSGTDASLASGAPGVWGYGNALDTRLLEWSCTGTAGPVVNAIANYRANAGLGGVNLQRIVYSATFFGDDVSADIATGRQQEVEVSLPSSLTQATVEAAIISAIVAKALTLGLVILPSNVIIL